ncbi:hypothetical protein ACJW30_04G050700 [Castanea mollissima]
MSNVIFFPVGALICYKKADYPVKVSGVVVSPNPVVLGKPATFNISATTGKPISSGKVVIDISYFGVHVHTENHDLSEEISYPIAAGKFVLSHSQTLPGFTPPKKKRDLNCIDF